MVTSFSRICKYFYKHLLKFRNKCEDVFLKVAHLQFGDVFSHVNHQAFLLSDLSIQQGLNLVNNTSEFANPCSSPENSLLQLLLQHTIM